ncbi:YrdB family protein [Thermopolyspora sp. NPDC052614]|uniref:YrdB family protein n=1 Tax=Thermopolyspora sp. NPDC052614 TaxID=3155682 RepID=UPI00343A84E7
MRDMAKGANLGLMFLLEIAVYLAVGRWGFTLAAALPVKLLAGLGGPLLFATVWGLLAAPKARVRLRGLARAGLEIAWFGGGAVALIAAGSPAAAAVFTALYLVNAALRITWHGGLAWR